MSRRKHWLYGVKDRPIEKTGYVESAEYYEENLPRYGMIDDITKEVFYAGQ